MISRDDDLGSTISWNRNWVLRHSANIKITCDVREDAFKIEPFRGIIKIDQLMCLCDTCKSKTVFGASLECLPVQRDHIEHLREASDQQTLTCPSVALADMVVILKAIHQNNTFPLTLLMKTMAEISNDDLQPFKCLIAQSTLGIA